jgi:hypothetical protein
MQYYITKKKLNNGKTIKILSRGWGPFVKDWWSTCSAHQEYNESCDVCQCGFWYNRLTMKFSQFVFNVMPTLWRWWVNIRIFD